METQNPELNKEKTAVMQYEDGTKEDILALAVDTDVEIPYEEKLKKLSNGEYTLEILVDMAKDGEIDPWDINLEDLTERFLKALSTIPRENLREAGKGLFFASVLLRMKSDVLALKASEALNFGVEEDRFEDLLEEELLRDATGVRQITFHDLEQAIKRRTVQKAKRYRRMTLEDLIGALVDAEKEEEARKERLEQQKLFDEFLDADLIVEPEVSDDILELTHAENIEEAIEKARGFVLEHLIDDNGVHFNELVKYLDSWSNAFLSILFLAHDNEVSLKQEEFYGDLWICKPENQA